MKKPSARRGLNLHFRRPPGGQVVVFYPDGSLLSFPRNALDYLGAKMLFGNDEWPQDSAADRKARAKAITREIVARTDELRFLGVRNPVTRAEREVAKRWQFASGHALNRWLRRNR